uniref:NACHT domain-containing protein n=1 Tax=Cyprinodon variegatus TaxID=28743 RepID=A0A3Q2DC45_CYPVA
KYSSIAGIEPSTFKPRTCKVHPSLLIDLSTSDSWDAEMDSDCHLVAIVVTCFSHNILGLQICKYAGSPTFGKRPDIPGKKHLIMSALIIILFQVLEDYIVTFIKNELRRIRDELSPFDLNCSESKRYDEQLEDEDEEKSRSSREAMVNITISFLRRMGLKKLADQLQSNNPPICQNKLKSSLKKRFQCVFEGIAKAGSPTFLNQIYTELFITEGGAGDVNDEHEVRQIEAASRKSHRLETTIRQEDIFKVPSGGDGPIRTVMTKGVAGIGKTVLTQKFTLDWAEGKSHQNIQFIFPFTFRELNVLRGKKFSLVELVHYFFTDTKKISDFGPFQVLFIFDGLDESRVPLDFHNKEMLTDATECTSVDVLLTNLIRGKLLPSAHLWITTRPAAANQIPPEFVGMVTDVRGFTDPQKENYFRKKFRDEKLASRIISHMKTSRSLQIMCHIPVFCLITATVLEDAIKKGEGGEFPKTLTEMYIHFLVVQIKVKMVKYDGGAETDPHWSRDNVKVVKSLGKLAFHQLQKGNLIFYESDLTECGIDIEAASVYSGVFTQIFREERGLYQERVYSFVHLSVQEFLAALYVHWTFMKFGENLIEVTPATSKKHTFFQMPKLKSLHLTAIDQALQSPHGHLDLFLRFLLGLSMQTNQRLLRGLLAQTERHSQTNQETAQYIKERISENMSAEKNINLFHCLNELNDSSLVEEIQKSLSSGSLSSDNLSPAQWSALGFILLSSGEDLDVFDLKKYSASEDVLLRLLPVVKASNKAILSGCNLSEKSCEALSSVLSSQSSRVTNLDLSNNDLKDLGMQLLFAEWKTSKYILETLSLNCCNLSGKSCEVLSSVLGSQALSLKELDLSNNDLQDSGVKLLSVVLESPHCKLEILRVEPNGVQWMTPGLKKYSCQLTIDRNTLNRELILSDNRRKVTRMGKSLSYADHPDRFDVPQLLCKPGLTGRCYWEVEGKGEVDISVSYKGIGRKGYKNDCWFGKNQHSWSLSYSDTGYSVWHNAKKTTVSFSTASSHSTFYVTNKVAVYLDFPAGVLSFFRVSSDTLIHLHTFSTTFTEPLYAGFTVFPNSSVFLC